ncbi:hypothetical protein [Tsukamurella paurometabola]|uniref:Sigma-70, region 4 n=1 Tax=Tsukamurella paurometabola TaxID=2061 RepID=A0A3P8JZV7_TSUPA|nr:hypothetical protein [Tsukamurella paurometabola]UEA81795.1 hypothetical protein LK411_15555 [Tsukamurella paurometabola]VDR38809.1 Uncharacterised protein [Tsukamurella paurometabola]
MIDDDPVAEELAQHPPRTGPWFRCRRAQMLRLVSFTGPDHWTHRQIATRYGVTVQVVADQIRQARREHAASPVGSRTDPAPDDEPRTP